MEEDKSLVPQQDSWINTPFAYTKVLAGKSRLEQDILFNVSASIQKFLKPFFDQNLHKRKDRPNPLFSQADLLQLEPIVVRMADYGINSAHYADIRKAVENILNIRLFIPIVEDGSMKMKWVNVFLEGETTLKGSYTYTNREGLIQAAMRSNGELRFKINKDVAAYAFDMSMGYIQHPQDIVRLVNANHTPLFYAMLKHYCGKGSKCRLTVKQIKEHLGLVKRDEEDRIVEYMLPKYSQFQKLVIAKVQADLQRAAKEGKLDIMISRIEEVRRDGKKTGDPLYIEFTIQKSDVGRKRDDDKYRTNSDAKLVTTLCNSCPDIVGELRAQLEEIVRGVSDSDHEAFVDFAYHEVPRLIEKRQPDDVPTYLLGLLRQWQADRATSKKEEKKVVQGSLFDPTEEEPAQPKKKPNRIPGAYSYEWQQVLELYDGEAKPLLMKARHVGSLQGYVEIEFPDKQSLDAFNGLPSMEHDALSQVMMQVLGPYGRVLKRGYKK